METRRTEVLVIGTGFGAAAPALRLAEAGVQVTMLEKGPNIDPDKDLRQTSDPKYILKYLKSVSGPGLDMVYAEGLGGGSPFYEMVSLRAPSIAFEQADHDGRRFWGPLGRKNLDPYYDLAERMLHVEQIAADEVPRTGQVFSYMMKRLGYSCERARFAVNGCVGSGYCITGCIFGAKQSLLLNYLPQAKSAGAQIFTDTDVLYIQPLGFASERANMTNDLSEMPYRYSVRCLDRKTGEEFAVESKCLILGAGTVGTAALLMRSGEYLPFLSRHVGRNIAFNGSVKCLALLADDLPDGDMLTGRTHPGMISYHFLDSHQITISAVKAHPIHIVTGARFWKRGESERPLDWGEAGDELMKQYRRRMMILYALGMTPPLGRLRMRSNTSFEPELEVTDELRAYYDRTMDVLRSIFTRNGCTPLDFALLDGEGQDLDVPHFGTTHMTSSARMAERAENGVIDFDGEVFHYPGLYVSDGAAVPTSLAVNTSLTILANAERIAEGLVRRFGRRTTHLPILTTNVR